MVSYWGQYERCGGDEMRCDPCKSYCYGRGWTLNDFLGHSRASQSVSGHRPMTRYERAKLADPVTFIFLR